MLKKLFIVTWRWIKNARATAYASLAAVGILMLFEATAVAAEPNDRASNVRQAIRVAAAYARSVRQAGDAIAVLRGQDGDASLLGYRALSAYRYSRTQGTFSISWGADSQGFWHQLYNGFVGQALPTRSEALSALEAILNGSLFSHRAELVQLFYDGRRAAFRYRHGAATVDVVFDLRRDLPREAFIRTPLGVETVSHIKVTKTEFGNVITGWCFELNCFRFDRVNFEASWHKVIPRPHQLEALHRALVLPFEKRDGLLIIPVQIYGKQFRFVFDTGTDTMVMNATAAAHLGIVGTARIHSLGSRGPETATLAIVDDVSVAGATFTKEKIAVSQSTLGYDGLIGGAFFGDSVIRIDYDTNAITVSKKRLCADLPMDTFDGRPEVLGRWKKGLFSFQLDTGAPFTVMLPQLKPSDPRIGNQNNSNGLLQFGSASLVPPKIWFTDPLLFLGRPQVGIIGGEILKEFNLGLDYGLGQWAAETRRGATTPTSPHLPGPCDLIRVDYRQ